MPYAPFEQICEHCGQPYVTRAKAQRYCSHRCGNLATRPKTYPSRQRVPRDPELLYQLYVVEGESTITLAERFGVKPFSVNRALKEAGIPRRAERGAADLRRIALGKQRAAKPGKYEAALLRALAAEGIGAIPQLAVDRFNVDLGFPEAKLAIEVDGGNWHESKPKRCADAVKTAFLAGQGWTELRVRAGARGWLTAALSDVLRALGR